MNRRAQHGMTLVEVLVALAILGAVASSILALISQNTRFIASVEDRTVAAILADNLLIEALAAETPLDRGEAREEVSFAGRSWFYAREVEEAGIEGVVRIDVAVRMSEGGQVLARVSTLKREAP